MTVDELRRYCLGLKGVSEDTPFDEFTLCFRIGGKIFAITSLDSLPPTVNLKCDPEKAIELREKYEEIQPGYHMNKKHWNTVNLTGELSDKMIYEMIDHSYLLVFSSLKSEIKKEIESK